MALELAPQDIRVNAICPGYLWARAWEMLAMMLKISAPQYADMERRDMFLDQVKRGVPLGCENRPFTWPIGARVPFRRCRKPSTVQGVPPGMRR